MLVASLSAAFLVIAIAQTPAQNQTMPGNQTAADNQTMSGNQTATP